MGTGNQTTRLIVQLGDGDDPEVFAHTCGANTFGISLANNLGENIMLDCDDPLDVPAAIVRHLESQDTSAVKNGGFWLLPAFLAGLELSKQNNGKVTFSATISGAGKRAWTDAT